jgi:hypothetical protein
VPPAAAPAVGYPLARRRGRLLHSLLLPRLHRPRLLLQAATVTEHRRGYKAAILPRYGGLHA